MRIVEPDSISERPAKSTVYEDFLAGLQELNLRIKQPFGAEGIEFAFSTQTVYRKQDSKEPA